MHETGTPRRTALAGGRPSRPHGAVWCGALMAFLAIAIAACRQPAPVKPSAVGVKPPRVEPFNFQISSGADEYQIEGFFARARQPGRLPALLVLNGDKGNARQCINDTQGFTEMGLQVACISIPGYGHSSGPSRFVGPPSVDAARHALDLLAARADVDPARLAVWGMADGAVAAGLLMDSDARPRAVILQSGAYDMVKLWPEATMRMKLSILRQVWPSKRALKQRSVVDHLPRRLTCSVLILHGERDRKTPIIQAQQLALALTERGAQVETYYFPQGSHELGASVDRPLRDFLRDHLLAANAAPAATPGPG
ncbi:MAG: prolyl oligopeptidase family serine peptidase [Candidatus Binataceae bacterium]|nr:prolyl oligopeptidase family serine peptidase [Candidatus Binataceae bacterium]